MHKPYLITGLPRSRTAWMAAFMGDCVHEPIVRMDALSDLHGLYFEKRGVSDSAAAFWLDRIMGLIGPQVVIIDRPIADVEASLAALNTGLPITNYCEVMLARMKTVRSDPRVMSVPFDALNDERTMQKVFWHLKPGEPFDEGRYREMKHLNIQVDIRLAMKAPRGKLLDEIIPYVHAKEGELACETS